jgi:hypothetical protein
MPVHQGSFIVYRSVLSFEAAIMALISGITVGFVASLFDK